MRLAKFECKGFMRFRTKQVLDLDPRVVCVVGPNAAGKSSLLDGLHLSTSDLEIEPRQQTRGLGNNAGTYVQATFALEAEDKAAIKGIREARHARRLIVCKDAGSGVAWLDPPVERRLQPRQETNRRLTAAKEAGLLRDLSRSDPDSADLCDQMFAEALRLTAGDTETLSQFDIDAIENLADHLKISRLPYRFRNLPDILHRLAETERLDHPADLALAALHDRIPRFEKFRPEQRELRSSYELSAEPNAALLNLLKLAGTTWEQLLQVSSSGDAGRKETWERRTAERLAETITRDWRQNQLSVRLRIDSGWLQVVMSIEGDDFFEVEQHSDGLLQFVALRAFIEAQRFEGRPIILLIDEAETHLHYDAQADLVSVLEDQRETTGVIYTTHSAGCLPRDLGVGVRAVVPTFKEEAGVRRQTDASEFVNSFWEHGSDFTPLLLVMGASTFAFAATRHAVVTEGLSDAMLLPELIREATGESTLSYQLVPGFAEARPEDVPRLDLLGARVAYLVDGDCGGRANATKLIGSGVLKEQVLHLGGRRSGLSVEDLLLKRVYVKAVNAQLQRLSNSARITIEDIPAKGRSAKVEDLFKRARDSAGRKTTPYKVNVAQRVLELRANGPLLDRTHRSRLVKLDKQLTKIFQKPTHTL